MNTRRLSFVLALAAMLLAGCDALFDSSSEISASRNPALPPSVGAQAGVTVGGQQDIRAVREIIESGGIPSASMIAPEGLFGEHDFAVGGASCDQLLCVTPGVALYHPVGGDTDRVLIQLIMSSDVNIEDFHHEPSRLVIVMDRSGSMGSPTGAEEPSKMEAVKAALSKVIGLLPDEDEMMLISFNHEYTEDLELAHLSGPHREAAGETIDSWQAGGSTDIESPLRRAFEVLDERANPQELARRVLLFTDALPNTGNYQDEDFITLTTRYAAKGIGLTVFGIGLDIGADLAKSISEIRGGNYVFLPDADEMDRMLTEDLEFLLSPIAYDFSLSVAPSGDLSLSNVFGMPGGDDLEFSLSAATLFLSSRKGALAVELTGPTETISGGGSVAEVTLRYTTLAGADVEIRVQPTLGQLIPGVQGLRVSDRGVEKIVALVNMANGMCQAITLHGSGAGAEASDLLDSLESHIAAVANSLDDPALVREADLVAQLRQNMASRQPLEQQPL